jgi:hypothetical protein
MARRIALIHAVVAAMEPVRAAFERLWPDAECVNVLDDALAPDRARDGELKPEMSRRIGALADYALSLQPKGILFTCSAFGPAIEAVAAKAPVPVLKPNEAMFEEAIELGTRIVMLVTFPNAAESMRPEFEALAKARSVPARLETVYVADAMAALKAGNLETHNRLIAEAARGLAQADAILLGQFSMAPAAGAVARVAKRPVLTSPESAVRKLKGLIEA